MKHEEYLAAINAVDMDSLQHHGILGMKWGIRRYQNPDGSLTPLGRKHYDQAEKAIAKFKDQKERAIAKGDENFARKNIDYLTNEDIQRFSDRIRSRASLDDMKQASRKITADKIDTWARMAQSGANLMSSGISIYNSMAKIVNAYTGKKTIPPLKDNDNPKDNGKGRNNEISEVYRNKSLEERTEIRFNSDGTKVTTRQFFNTKDDKKKKG